MKNFIVGYTGTRQGMTQAQRDTLRALLADLCPAELHHGDCIGGDVQADAIAKELGIATVLHPPIASRFRAFCKGAKETREPKSYLERNHEIVDEVALLFAAPYTRGEVQRSGTWATIRYAEITKTSILRIYLDGDHDA